VISLSGVIFINTAVCLIADAGSKKSTLWSIGRTLMQRTVKFLVVLASLAIGAMTALHALPAAAEDQVSKSTSPIDVASVVNFSKPDTKAAKDVQPAGAIVSTSGNPSVAIGMRPQAPTSELKGYRNEPSQQGRKNGIMADGVMAAIRISI
jgi:hypothetical protein